MLAECVFYHAETQFLGSKDKVSETIAHPPLTLRKLQ